MSDANEYDFEPVPGLPEELPEGEKMIWQGAPTWRNVALHVFHVRKLAFYFAALLVLRHFWLASTGQSALTDIAASSGLVFAAVFSIGLLIFLARQVANTTLYTITSKRVVLRIGIALPMTLNLPFSRITVADLRKRGDGSGDILMQLGRDERLSYLVLWPHVKLRSLLKAQPAMRSLPDPEIAAQHLADAIQASGMRSAPESEPEQNANPVLAA
ncbi:MAG: photosynthetic complex putative assembly protein PuhB [Gammaproteobacteria bacterium]